MSHAHDHDHSHARETSRRALAIALALTTTFMIAEVVGGLLTGSLALLADAGHMLSDSFSLGLALFAGWLARRPPTSTRTFGLQRAEILAALFNGVTLVAISIWIFVEAGRRFSAPPDVEGGWLLVVAVLGLAVNVAAAFVLSSGAKGNLNVSAALRHVFADVLGSVGVIVSATVILLTGWNLVDPLVSVLIGILVLASSWGILRDTTRVLLEATPEGIDAAEVGAAMVSVDGVKEVHDLHVWTVTSGFPALSAHVLVGKDDDCHAQRRTLEQMLHRRFGIDHTTLQVDHVENGAPLHIEGPVSEARP